MMAFGRPPTWTDPEKLQALIDQYFKDEKQPTLAGLAVALDVSRSTLYEYDNKDDFSDIIKKARAKVLKIYEHRLLYSDKPTGVIFALKNMGWKDRQDVTSNDRALPTPILGTNVPSDPSDK